MTRPARNKEVQFCPRCGSLNIELASFSKLGDPFLTQASMGWECRDCGHVGIDFFIVSEEEYEKIKEKFMKR